MTTTKELADHLVKPFPRRDTIRQEAAARLLELEAELALVNESNAQLREQNETLDSLMRGLEAAQYRPAPCHKFCEANAFKIEIRGLEAEIFRLREHIIDQTKLEQEINQLRKERQAFKDVTEYQKAENAQLLADLKVCQAKNRELNTALDEWIDKTDWVQKTATSMELGLHRADVLKQRIAGRAALGETK